MSPATTIPHRARVLVGLREPRVGGAERMVIETLPLARESFDVEVAVLAIPTGTQAMLEREPVRDLREILAGDHDVLHTHLFLPGVAARLRRIWDSRIRWVHSVHYLPERTGLGAGIRRALDRWVYRATDQLVAVSPSVYETVRELPQAHLLPNAIRMDRIGASVEPRTEDDLPVVGSVAMLRREKGIADLVQAARLLRDRGVPVLVRVAGDGPLRGQLTELIAQLHMQEHVELTGFVHDVGPFYGELDVYVQPSIAEGFGMAVLDSFRHGRPTVATSVGYLPELLGRGEYGVLVDREPDAPAAIAAGIEEALAARSELSDKAEAGREHWARSLDPAARARALGRIYRAALEPRVCFVAPIATHGGGGIQRQILLQTRALGQLGVRTSLLQRHDPELGSDPEKAEEWRHVEVLPTATPFRRARSHWLADRVRGGWFVLAGLARLWRARRRIDVVHGHQLFSPTVMGAIAKRLWGVRLVVKVTASGEGVGEVDQIGGLGFAFLRRWAVGQIDGVIVLTESMGRELRRFGVPDDRIHVIPNSVSVPDEPVSLDRDTQAPFELLSVGRLSTEKSLDTLVRAAGLLAERGRKVRVLLVGAPDPVRDPTDGLRALVDELPVTASVELCGPTDDVERYYRHADAFVLPSLSEGMSNSLLEAMALGMTCICSDIPQNRALIEDAIHGLLFPVTDASALADRVEALIDDREAGGRLADRLGAAARERIQAGYSAEAVAERLRALYRAVLA